MSKEKKESPSEVVVEESRFPKKYFILTSIIILVLIAGYYFFQYQNSVRLLQNPTELANLEVKKLVESVGKIIDLPKNEVPTVATVKDKSQLKGQHFFDSSENGDKVLLYEKNKKAILYRPSTNKIIEISNISPSSQTSIPTVDVSTKPQQSPTTDPTPTITRKATVTILNGTKVAGLASATEKKLDSDFSDKLETTATGNARNKYSKTMIIDLTGHYDSLINELVTSLKGSRGTFPQEEIKPKTDLLIILGQ